MEFQNKPLRSFGRLKSRRLRDNSQRLMDEVLPRVKLKCHNDENGTMVIVDPRLNGNDTREVWIEIGFGGGEHLAHQARSNAEIFHMGFEPFINGTVKLLREVEEQNLTNVAVFNGDAREVIEKLPAGSISKAFILFPDPWPKARHHKRRIIQADMLDMLQRALKKGGVVRLATDHAEYGEWMQEKFAGHKGFKQTLKTYEAPVDHIITKYQRKGLAGNNPVFLEYSKI